VNAKHKYPAAKRIFRLTAAYLPEKGIIIGGVQLVVFTTKMILLCLTKGISKTAASVGRGS
jgi:hypothetical protein